MPRRRARRTAAAAPRRGALFPSWFLLAICLGAAYMGYRLVKVIPDTPDYGYRVVSVKAGAVWAVDRYGAAYEFRDAQLVKAALTGKIKAGDKIQP